MTTVTAIDVVLEGDDFPNSCTDGDAYCDTVERKLRREYRGAKVTIGWSNLAGSLKVVPDTDEAYEEVQGFIRGIARGIEHDNWEQAA